MLSTKIQKTSLFAGIILFAYVFLKNAWISDDAYVGFRMLEQLVAGNGPVWNPHERVQIYVVPLWMGAQTLFRILSSNVFLNAIFASAIFCGLMLFVVKKMLQNNTKWFFFIVLLLCSSAFFDFTSSGHENAIAYFFIALYLFYYHRLFTEAHSSKKEIALITRVIFSFGLVILCRYDLATLLLIPSLFVFWVYRKKISLYQWASILFRAFLPLIAFLILSLIYYGSIIPHPAYNKLNTGISKLDLINQGIKYFFVSFWVDTITLAIITITAFCSFFSNKKHVVFLSYGILTNLAYVLFVGGCYMQGRFISYAYLLSVVVLLLYSINIDVKNDAIAVKIKIEDEKKTLLAALIVCLLYICFYPHTPAKSPIDYHNRDVRWGITDERGYYFGTNSLWKYITRDKKKEYFPDHIGSRLGFEFSKSKDKIYTELVSVGSFGYWAGTDKIIIDSLTTADPLLARLPVRGEWRIGHFQRIIPLGYKESILNNSAELKDPGLNEFYKKIRLITQSKKLFSLERIKTIIAMNLGLYNHYLRHYIEGLESD